MTTRMGVMLTDEMEAVIKRLAGERGATLSNLVRIALIEWLADQGETVTDTGLKWGGPRVHTRRRARPKVKQIATAEAGGNE